jgi:MtN3 and saliva related transmembrane protein
VTGSAGFISGRKSLRREAVAVDGIEYVGLVASTLATFAFLPQVVKTWRTRSANDFSLATLFLLEAGTGLWVVYGVWRDAPAIWLGNAVTFALAGFILSVKMKGVLFSRRSPAARSKPSSSVIDQAAINQHFAPTVDECRP